MRHSAHDSIATARLHPVWLDAYLWGVEKLVGAANKAQLLAKDA